LRTSLAETVKPRLLTIPISHFCEKARCALELAGFDYVEEPHVQLVHRFVALRTGAGRQVPILITPERAAIAPSGAIVRWADRAMPAEAKLVPPEHAAEIDALERDFDEVLGPEARRWMYSSLLSSDIPMRFGNDTLPGWERRVLRHALPVFKLYAARVLRAAPAEAAEALAAVEATFGSVEERIADGRRYLIGDRFTAADLTFASLSAAVLMPERYGTRLPQPPDLPPSVAETVLRLRDRPAGRFAARLVAEHRPEPRLTAAATV
jgi:glutathione S-transferase